MTSPGELGNKLLFENIIFLRFLPELWCIASGSVFLTIISKTLLDHKFQIYNLLFPLGPHRHSFKVELIQQVMYIK